AGRMPTGTPVDETSDLRAFFATRSARRYGCSGPVLPKLPVNNGR
ncbi:hypothetical protein GA0115246_110461, partial [Streptomyces sp. SolWspMP-sol7th]